MTTQNLFNGGGLFGGGGGLNEGLINAFEESDLGRQAIFQSYAPGNLSLNQRNQFSNLYTPTFNNYLSGLGKQIRQGQIPGPDQTFNNFLGDNQQNNPNRLIQQLPSFSFGGSGLGPNIFNFGGR